MWGLALVESIDGSSGAGTALRLVRPTLARDRDVFTLPAGGASRGRSAVYGQVQIFKPELNNPHQIRKRIFRPSQKEGEASGYLASRNRIHQHFRSNQIWHPPPQHLG